MALNSKQERLLTKAPNLQDSQGFHLSVNSIQAVTVWALFHKITIGSCWRRQPIWWYCTGSVANIKVIGVGGGGGNAVNRMIASDVAGIEWSINTPMPKLLPVPQKAIGQKLTGSGEGNPAIGQAAEESRDEIATTLRMLTLF